MNRLRVDAIPPVGGTVLAAAAESHHLLHVSRVARGATVQLADGRGALAHAELVGVESGLAALRVTSLLPAVLVPDRVVLLGLPKAPAVEEALTLGTEAGVTRFVLVEAERTPPGRVRPDRMERVMRAAVTQCGRGDNPEIVGPLPLSGAIGLAVGDRWVATPGAGTGASAGSATIAIGPEGGWAPGELAVLIAAGFHPLGLGPHLLRTPTAVAVALGVLRSG